MYRNGSERIERKDHRVHENGDSELSSIGDVDPWTAWAYQPRTISLLLVGACFLIWASGALDPEISTSGDVITSVKRGIWAMIAVFLAYCLLQAPSTMLIRPHPAMWRLVHGMAVTYLVFLTFLLFQKRDDARQFMKFLHPDLGVELPERSYGADCRIYTPEHPTSRFKNLYDTFFDEFVLAHIFGWWGKAILIRNQSLLWVLSVGFELLEVFCSSEFVQVCLVLSISVVVLRVCSRYLSPIQFTFRHMLPNFNECWWDSIVLDILTCNWFGIWAGMRTVRYFDGKTYEWIGISRQPNIIGKMKRTLGQFTPAQWDKDEWHPLLGPWRFLQVLTLCIVFMTVELNTFFLKFCFWIPPRNPVIIYRLILWWLIAIPTIREYNSYLQDRKPDKKVGAFCWLSVAICIVELLICIKFGHGLYPNPMPRPLVMFWTFAGVSLVAFMLVWSSQLHRTSLERKRR
ncbi:CDP-diacylglycerol--serine O-phosphatidyltransferase 1 [Linum grandiflorum]